MGDYLNKCRQILKYVLYRLQSAPNWPYNWPVNGRALCTSLYDVINLNVTGHSWFKADGRTSQNTSICTTLVFGFWLHCDVATWKSTLCITDEGPISRLNVLSQHPTFCNSQKGYEIQKVARVKEASKRKGKGQEKKFETGDNIMTSKKQIHILAYALML